MIAPLRLYSLAATGLALAGAGVYYLMQRSRKSPEERERERRSRLSQMGRIIDGTVTDVAELPPEPVPAKTAAPSGMQLLIYCYDVGGVQYEASQDVTQLRHRVDLHTCRLGLPTSVKYDPQNPANSIVISEEWSGLRR